MSSVAVVTPVVEEEYEVEKIVGHKVKRTKRNSKFTYFIKWLNYDTSENTWEKEENVYATNMIADYWSRIARTDPDRISFEEMQSRKKDPILLSTPPPKVAQVISHASPSPPSSPVLSPSVITANRPVQAKDINEGSSSTKTITESNTPDKSTPVKNASGPSSTTTKSKSASTTPVIAEPKPERTIANIFRFFGKKKNEPVPASASSEKESKGLSSEEPMSVDTPESKEQDPSLTVSSDEEYMDVPTVLATADEEDEEDESTKEKEDELEEQGDVLNRRTTRKRTRSGYTDYFIEQHKKKKLSGRGYEDEDDSSVEENKTVQSSLKNFGSVVFDSSISKDTPLDWNSSAKKVDYIGREVSGGPVYCLVSWEDDIKSLHDLEIVRAKRPDLVIDAFVALL